MHEEHERFKPGDWLLYKNNQLIAFNKPCGIPVQDDPTGDVSLQSLAESYSRSKLQLIHRIDRPSSGVVLFAKTDRSLKELNEQFREREVSKTYLALVSELPAEKEGSLVHFLGKRGTSKPASVSDAEFKGAKKAVLQYKVLGSTDRYHLLEINLHTGRHHQIRAQLAAIGCPIKGDVKYGFKRANADRSIHLHAWKIRFRHPVSGEEEQVIAPLPGDPAWDACAPFLV